MGELAWLIFLSAYRIVSNVYVVTVSILLEGKECPARYAMTKKKSAKEILAGIVVPPEPPPQKIKDVEGMVRWHLDLCKHEDRDYARLASILKHYVFEPDPKHPRQ